MKLRLTSLFDRESIRVAGAAIAMAGLTVTLFAWPQARSGPRDLPVGLAGPPRALSSLERGIARAPDGFRVIRYADAAAARKAIQQRKIYGALVASSGEVTLLTAPAASSAVAQLLERTFHATATRPPSAGGHVSASDRPAVVEVVPGSAADPRGAAFSSSILPLILAGMVSGVLIARLRGGVRRSIALLLGAAALAGVTAIAIIQSWLGVIEGGWLVNAGVVALVVLAIAAIVTGLMRLIGTAGTGVAALLFMLIGNPWSGISTAPGLLREPASAIGQLLPPGAGGELLRSTAFFDGAKAGGHLAVLIGWSLVGLTALSLASLRSRPSALRPVEDRGKPKTDGDHPQRRRDPRTSGVAAARLRQTRSLHPRPSDDRAP